MICLRFAFFTLYRIALCLAWSHTVDDRGTKKSEINLITSARICCVTFSLPLPACVSLTNKAYYYSRYLLLVLLRNKAYVRRHQFDFQTIMYIRRRFYVGHHKVARYFSFIVTLPLLFFFV